MRSGTALALLALAACSRPSPAPEPSATPTAQPAPGTAPEPSPNESAQPDPAASGPAAPAPTPPAVSTPAIKPELRMQALGTEPFWSVDVLPHARLRYATPDMANGVIVSAVERKRGKAVRYAGRLNRHLFRLDIVPGTCSDGMSDTVYPYKATLVHSGRTDHGCARLR